MTKTTYDETTDVLPLTNLGWSDETPGEAVFVNPNTEDVSFVLTLFKDGDKIMDWTFTDSSDSIPLYYDMDESGTYTYLVETFGYGVTQDYDWTEGCVSELSPAFVYSRPSEQVGIPENISWSSAGVVSCDPVAHASWYLFTLCRADESAEGGYRSLIGHYRTQLTYDFSNDLAEGYDYSVKVRVISENINKYANGEWSAYVPFNGSAVAESVNEKLDEATSNPEDNIETVVATVKENFANSTAKDELRVAMQTSEETQGKIQKIETEYIDAKGITINVDPGDSGIEKSDVTLLGAALNAKGAGEIDFNLSAVDDATMKNLITNELYKRAVALDIQLQGAGIVEGATLDIPVTVTMPIPAALSGVSIDDMVILHYNDNGSYERVVPVRLNADGTISFTVLHFSTFVFAEEEASGSDSENKTETSNSGSGSGNKTEASGGSSGSSSGGSSNWVPVTPDEIARFSVVGKEPVEYKVRGDYDVNIVNVIQGRKCFDSFEAVLGDYTIARTYNILPDGKKVYSKDDTLRITLNIPEALQADGREFKMICVTKDGLPVVLEDLDLNPDTITIETNLYYAFALIYKDIAAVQ